MSKTPQKQNIFDKYFARPVPVRPGVECIGSSLFGDEMRKAEEERWFTLKTKKEMEEKEREEKIDASEKVIERRRC